MRQFHRYPKVNSGESVFFLPWPPSVNRYWRHIVVSGSPRVLISKWGVVFRELVIRHLTLQRLSGVYTDRLKVEIIANPPDRRIRDLDNLLKAVLDSLVHAHVILDDNLIDELSIRRGDVMKNGRLQVTIRPVALQ